MSENRRVVVTGLGAVTPLGLDVKTTWEGFKNGANGIGPITLFNTENFKATLAAEVKDFDPKEYLEVNEILRTDRYAQFAVAAAKQAADDSKIEGNVAPERFAVLFGTGIGGINTFETEHAKLLDKGPRRVSPLFVPMMIANMASGIIAMKHGCNGSALCHGLCLGLQCHRRGGKAYTPWLCRRRDNGRRRSCHNAFGCGRICQYARPFGVLRPRRSISSL